MNSLSWMIYFAGLTGSLSGLLIAAAVIGIGIGGFCLALGETAFRYGPDLWSWDDKKQKQAAHDKVGNSLRTYGKRGVVLGISAALIACILPSQSTVYAIAASEMGERAIASQTGGKALKALDAWLDRQITDKPEEHNGNTQ